jgi:nucleotide-binding universal stress UspA family protein
VLGSIIDHVLENAPCDVGVVKTGGPGESGEILVPTVGGPQAELGEDIAASIATASGNPITLLTVATGDREAAETILEERSAALSEAGVEATTDIVESDDIPSAIVDYATENEFESIIIGAAEEGLLRRVLVGEIPEIVGEQFDGQVIMVKKHQPVRSLIGKWVSRGGKSRVSS